MASEDARKAARRVRRVRQVAWALVAIVWVWAIADLAISPREHQRDMQTYYWAARAAAEGANPYDPAELSARSGEAKMHPWLYSPIMLIAFRPLSMMPLTVALQAWLVLKLAMVGLLLWLWRRHFLQDLDPLLLAVVALLGFRASLLWDLQAGNVSVIEQVLLWSGFVCLMRGRRAAFAALLVAASVMKLALIVLLPLVLLWPGDRRRGLAIALAAVMVFGALVLGPLAAHPDWLASWAGALASINEVGVHTPSALAISTALAWEVVGETEGTPALAWGIYVPYAFAMLLVSVGTLRRAWRRGDHEGLLMGALILYALVVPRFKSYSFVMLIPPTLILWRRIFARYRTGEAAWAALVAIPGGERLAGILGSIYAFYYVTVLVAAIWLCYVWLQPDEPEAAEDPRQGAPTCGDAGPG